MRVGVSSHYLIHDVILIITQKEVAVFTDMYFAFYQGYLIAFIEEVI